MDQEIESEISASIVKDRRKMFEQNDKIITKSVKPKNLSPTAKENKETKFVPKKSESKQISSSQSPKCTAVKPPEIIRPAPKRLEVIRNKIETSPNSGVQNKPKKVQRDIKPETANQSENMNSQLSKKVKFCEDLVLPTPPSLPKSEKVNQALNTENLPPDIVQNSVTTQALSAKLEKLNPIKSPLLIPPPPPTKSEKRQNVEIAKLSLVPLPPPFTDGEILKPNSSIKPNLISETPQTRPVPPVPPSTKPSSTHSNLPPSPPTIPEPLSTNISSKGKPVSGVIQKHPAPPPPPPSVTSETSKKEISNNLVLPSNALAPPVPPPPSAKELKIINPDSLNNLPQEHPVTHEVSRILGNIISDTVSCDNLTPPVPPPPPPSGTKTSKQSNSFVGWAINSSSEQKRSSNEFVPPTPIENKTRKPLETSKAPPIVTTPPSLESVRKVKEK